MSFSNFRKAVFHSGALTGIWGGRVDFEAINIGGTQNILDACNSQGIKKLIYTSSPSVVFGETHLENANESTPYPSHFLSDYPRTKAEAEQRVLKANEPEVLQTIALRPHLIWGPGDPHLAPRILERGRKRKLVRVGDGTNKVSIIYIDNAVEGHIRALESLRPGSSSAGKPYFLSDDEPVLLWDWINRLLKAMQLPPVNRSISYKTGKRLGGLMEWVYRTLNLKNEPRLTRFVASQLATSHYFDTSAAKRDLGYAPVVSPEIGWERMIEWFRTHPAD